ncbi:hypothetical protein ES707_12192 [subsurface metagenome]
MPAVRVAVITIRILQVYFKLLHPLIRQLEKPARNIIGKRYNLLAYQVLTDIEPAFTLIII